MPSLNTPTSIEALAGYALNPCSTNTPLGSNATFSGAWCNITQAAMLTIAVFADQNSAANGLKFQWSSDGTNIDLSEDSIIIANTGRAFSLTPRAPYFRIEYTNGASAQSVFRLHVHLHTGGTGLISHPLSKSLDDNNFAQTVRSVLTGKKSDETYRSVAVSDSGKLLVEGLEQGGSSFNHKLRITSDFSSSNLSTSFVSKFSVSGSGLFSGFKIKVSNTSAAIRVIVDSETLFDLDVAELNDFTFNDYDNTGLQKFFGFPSYGEMEFFPPRPISFNSSISVEIKKTVSWAVSLQKQIYFYSQD